jgi:hypothetical protein
VPPVVAAATVTVTLASPVVTVEMVGTPGAATASTTPETAIVAGTCRCTRRPWFP